LYEETGYQWEQQAALYELPAFGQVTYHDCAIKLSFPEAPPDAPPEDAPNVPVRDFRPVYHSHAILDDAAPGYAAAHGLPVRNGKARRTLAIRMQDQAYPFVMILYYRVSPEHDIVERWVELRNETGMAVRVEALAFATLHLPNGPYEVTRPAGNWGREFAMARHALPPHKVVVDQKGLNTGHHANPFL
jgi:alpha-galactosidase